MAERAEPNGTESQGVKFVLAVQDFSSEILNKANKAYQNLLDSMKKVAQASNNVASQLTGQMAKAAASTQANGGIPSIITPFTVNQKAVDAIPKLNTQTASWFKTVLSNMQQWLSALGLAGSRTRDVRDNMAQARMEAGKFSQSLGILSPLLQGLKGGHVELAGLASGLSAGIGIHEFGELYERMNTTRIMEGKTTQATQEMTQRFIASAAATGLSADAYTSAANALSSYHIQVTGANEGLVRLIAQASKLSELKEGGSLSPEAMAGTVAQLVNMYGLSNTQIAQFANTAYEATKKSQLGMSEIADFLGHQMVDTINLMTKSMEPLQKADFVSRLIPQLIAAEAAFKQVGVSADVVQKIVYGLTNPNSPEAHHLMALMQGAYSGAAREAARGNITGALDAVIKDFRNQTKYSPATLKALEDSGDLSAIGGKDTVLRLAQLRIGVDDLSKSVSHYGQSWEEASAEMHKALANQQNTPLGQLHITEELLKDIFAIIFSNNTQGFVSVLKAINAGLLTMFDFFKDHQTLSSIISWASAAAGAFTALSVAIKAMDFIGLLGGFRALTGVFMGLTEALGGGLVGGMAALAVSVGVIKAGFAAIKWLYDNQDWVQAQGTKFLQDRDSFVGHRVVTKQDIDNWVQKHLGGSTTNNTVNNTVVDNSKSEEHLAALRKHIVGSGKASGPSPLAQQAWQSTSPTY